MWQWCDCREEQTLLENIKCICTNHLYIVHAYANHKNNISAVCTEGHLDNHNTFFDPAVLMDLSAKSRQSTHSTSLNYNWFSQVSVQSNGHKQYTCTHWNFVGVWDFFFFSKIKSAMLEVCQFKCGLMIYILMRLCTSMVFDPPNRIYDFWQHIYICIKFYSIHSIKTIFNRSKFWKQNTHTHAHTLKCLQRQCKIHFNSLESQKI